MEDFSGTLLKTKARLLARLRVPAVAAPMFLVSGPDLVISACRAGIIGSFPTLNARTSAALGEWLDQITRETAGYPPFAANMILHKSNTRLEADFEQVLAYKTPIVITSVGRPDRIVERVHEYGGLVWSDVASLRHARNAADAGVDGLILLTAGAGGNTGWLNPFAFVSAVREFFDGLLAVAGCISHGRELRALHELGAELGYMGTAFLAAMESLAPAEHKQAMCETDADGIILTSAVSGMPANFIRRRLEDAGALLPDGSFASDARNDVFSWKNVWSAGQGVAHVRSIEPVSAIVDRLEKEYKQHRLAS